MLGNHDGRHMRLDELYDVVMLPAGPGPVHLAVALPNDRYREILPDAALPESGRIASGRGLTVEACRQSCLGEAAELASCCAWGDEPLLPATAKLLGSKALPIRALDGLSAEQIAGRTDWNRAYDGFDWRPRAFNPDAAIAWLPVINAFDASSVLVPADFMLIGRREAGDEEAATVADSNGCAAGQTADAARFSALLELIERDATARWWYGRRVRNSVALEELAEAMSVRMESDLSALAARGRRSRVFDITTDLGVPAFATVSAEPDGQGVALGFAAKASRAEAILSAITEMLQMEFSLAMAQAEPDASSQWTRWLSEVTLALPPLDARSPCDADAFMNDSAPVTLESALDACARSSIGIWFADLTRAAIGVPVFRALSTELCHYKPRFERTRLLAPDPRDLAAAARDAESQVPLLV
jgi:ribosomal protein S12 methylthiotransferase accessory factor